MGTRDEIRAGTVGAKKAFRSEVVEVDAGGGAVAIEVRELSVAQEAAIRKRYLKETGELLPNGTAKIEFDAVAMQVQTVIESCFVPGTEERVFEAADAEGLAAQPAGGWIKTLYEATQRVGGALAGKNSGATPSGK